MDALEDKRRKACYSRYWEPITADQEKAVRLLADPKIKIALVRGGNRSGKSEIGGWIASAYFLGKEAFRDEPSWEWVKDLPIPADRPRNIWIVGLDFPTLRDVLWREKLRIGKTHPPFIPAEGMLNVKKINDSDYQIFGEDGSVITGKSADSGREKFQGASCDLVWIDEEPNEDVYDECYQRTVDCAGKILVTLTPLNDVNAVRTPWVFNLVDAMRAGKAPDVATVELSVLDNPLVSDDEKQKLKVKWAGHPEEEARLYGKFIRRSGLVYNIWDPAKHLVKPFLVPLSWRRIASIDPANTGPTACLWAAVDPSGNLFFYREYKEADLTIGEHARNISVRTAEPVDVWLIDPKWGSQREGQAHKTGQQLYRDAGIPARLAVVGEDYGLNASREFLNNTIANTPGPRVYIFADLTAFRWEIERYVWDSVARGPAKGLSKQKPRKGNDDLMNSFQYLCAGRFRPRGGSQSLSSQVAPGGNSYT